MRGNICSCPFFPLLNTQLREESAEMGAASSGDGRVRGGTPVGGPGADPELRQEGEFSHEGENMQQLV